MVKWNDSKMDLLDLLHNLRANIRNLRSLVDSNILCLCGSASLSLSLSLQKQNKKFLHYCSLSLSLSLDTRACIYT
jgi:hypothetical protein